ncbi:hypothetical protein ACQB60_34250 [Actinomycetota bacterium Odt1-20B]
MAMYAETGDVEGIDALWHGATSKAFIGMRAPFSCEPCLGHARQLDSIARAFTEDLGALEFAAGRQLGRLPGHRLQEEGGAMLSRFRQLPSWLMRMISESSHSAVV